MTDSSDLAKLFAKLYIARPDVKAIQASTGAYYTHTVDRNANPPVYLPFDMKSIVDHIEGRATYGHYLLGTDNSCKIIAFDIDLVKEPTALPTRQMPKVQFTQPEESADMEGWVKDWEETWEKRNPRDAWLNRADPARDFIKIAMRTLAHKIRRSITDVGVPTAVTYTGAKGLHVYGFLGKGKDGTLAREVIDYVLSDLELVALRGKNFYGWPVQDDLYDLFSIETFPKQAVLSNTDGFGNLMRLPLGRNLKSVDPTFFVDTEAPMGVLRPVDALATLQAVDKELSNG